MPPLHHAVIKQPTLIALLCHSLIQNLSSVDPVAPLPYASCSTRSAMDCKEQCCAGPVSPRTARRTTTKGRKARVSPRARLVLGLGIALGLIALCIISGYLLLPLSGFGTLKSFLAGTVAPSSTRRLLSSKPTSLEPQHDAYTVRHRQHTETFHASRWDSHMAGRVSRQLAESADGAAGTSPCRQLACISRTLGVPAWRESQQSLGNATLHR